MTGSDRMPPLEPADLDASQAAALRRIVSGPRGALVGPFTVLLRTPVLMDRLQEVGAFLRYEKSLPAHLFEMAVLMVARHWDQGFEWAHHQPLALAAGLDPVVVEALGRDLCPETEDLEVTTLWSVVDQLHHAGGTLDDATYAAATASWGEAGLVEVVATVGYYATLAMVMNVARTPPEAGAVLPPRRPGPRS